MSRALMNLNTLLFLSILGAQPALAEFATKSTNETVPDSAAQIKCPMTPKIEIKIVRGESMRGVFNPGQELKADMNYYLCHVPKPGDYVLIRKARFKADLIKRVFVGPGQTFKLMPIDPKQSGPTPALMTIDGQEMKSPLGKVYRFSGPAFKMLKLYEDAFKGVMPKDMYFVFGSGEADSRDSAKFGPVERREIVGKIVN